MPRQAVTLLLALALFLGMVGVAMAEDAVIVSYTAGKIVMNIGNKTETLVTKGVKITDSGGTEIKPALLVKTLKKGTKVALVKEKGKITMVVVK
jgi:hypothetical protein